MSLTKAPYIRLHAGTRRRAVEAAVLRLRAEGLKCLWCVDAVRQG